MVPRRRGTPGAYGIQRRFSLPSSSSTSLQEDQTGAGRVAGEAVSGSDCKDADHSHYGGDCAAGSRLEPGILPADGRCAGPGDRSSAKSRIAHQRFRLPEHPRRPGAVESRTVRASGGLPFRGPANHVLSSQMQRVFGDFNGRVSIHRSPPRKVLPEFASRAERFVRSLR